MKQLLCTTAVVVIAATSSTPARTCTPLLTGLQVPFAGRQVPRNAVLRAPSLNGDTRGLGPITMRGPDGLTATGTWVAEGTGARLDLDDDSGLAPGTWTHEIENALNTFEVIADVDNTAPTGFLRATRHLARDQIDTTCGEVPDQIELAFDTFPDAEVEGPTIAVIERTAGEALRLAVVDGAFPRFDDDGGALSIRLIDMADNQTDVEIGVDDIRPAPVSFGNDATCANVSASTTSLLAALLLLMRRRRSA